MTYRVIIFLSIFLNGVFQLRAEKDSDQSLLLYDSALSLISTDLNLAYNTAEEAKEVSGNNADYLGLTKANYLMGYCMELEGKLDKAAILYFESLRYLETLDYDRSNYYYIASNKNIGKIFYVHHQYNEAIKFYQESLDHGFKTNSKLLSSVLYDKALAQKELNDYLGALESLNEGSIYAQKFGDDEMLIRINLQLGLIFKDLGKLNEARNHYFRIFEFRNSVLDFNKHAWSAYHTIATTYLLEKDTLQAQKYFKEAIASSTESSAPDVGFISYLDLGETFMKQGNFVDAEFYYLEGLGLPVEIETNPDKFKIYKQLSALYGYLGDAKKFAEYNTKYTQCLEKHLKTSEELAQMDQQYNIQLVTQRYFELVESQKRMAALKKYGGFAVAGILSFILIFLIVSRIRKTRLKKSLEQELKEAMQGLDFDL